MLLSPRLRPPGHMLCLHQMVIKGGKYTLKDAGIPKFVPNAQPNPQGSVPRKPPSALVALKPPGGNGVPQYVFRSVPNPSVNSADGNSIPNTSVNKGVGNLSPNHSINHCVKKSGIQNGVNSAQDQKVQNKGQVQKVQNNAVNTSKVQKGNEIPIVNSVPSSSNVPKLEISKETKEKFRESKNPTGNGDNNKTIPKVSAPKAQSPKPNIQENNTLRRSNRVSKPNKKYLDVASIISNLKFWKFIPLIILTFKQFEL